MHCGSGSLRREELPAISRPDYARRPPGGGRARRRSLRLRRAPARQPDLRPLQLRRASARQACCSISNESSRTPKPRSRKPNSAMRQRWRPQRNSWPSVSSSTKSPPRGRRPGGKSSTNSCVPRRLKRKAPARITRWRPQGSIASHSGNRTLRRSLPRRPRSTTPSNAGSWTRMPPSKPPGRVRLRNGLKPPTNWPGGSASSRPKSTPSSISASP